jgi:hypothetical protein
MSVRFERTVLIAMPDSLTLAGAFAAASFAAATLAALFATAALAAAPAARVPAAGATPGTCTPPFAAAGAADGGAGGEAFLRALDLPPVEAMFGSGGISEFETRRVTICRVAVYRGEFLIVSTKSPDILCSISPCNATRTYVRADEKLTMFIELELALAPQNGSPRIRQCPT